MDADITPFVHTLPATADGRELTAEIATSLAEEDQDTPARPGGPEADWDRRYADDEHTWGGNPNGTLVAELDGFIPGRALDVGAGEGADAIAAALRADPQTWQIEVEETRPRPAGAVSTHHVDDVVLRARRTG